MRETIFGTEARGKNRFTLADFESPREHALRDPDRRERYWKRYRWVLERWGHGLTSAKSQFFDRVIEARPNGYWLDAGCGRRTFPTWRPEDAERMRAADSIAVGCDADKVSLRDRSDGALVCAAYLENLPFSDEAFCFVISNMVFEHVRTPQAAVEELVRVSEHSGRILIHTVNSRHYLALIARLTPHRFHEAIVRRFEGRLAMDVYPTCYAANTLTQICALFELQGWRRVWGGEVSDLPVFAPIPFLFWISLLWGIIEVKLSRIPVIGSFLRPNLLIEFQRDA